MTTTRMGRTFGRTLREAPSGVEAVGHGLLLRAGFVRQLAAGIFCYLPLGWRALGRIGAVLREEMDACGGQEVSLPVVHPAEVWERSGRYGTVGPELARFSDRRGREMVLAMTHEEVVAYLAAGEISSYRQLPRLVYQIQTKFRDDARPRAGLIRAREFTMKDAYSLDRDEAGLDRRYRALHRAYLKTFGRCGLPVVSVESDTGIMGGSEAHEFMYLSPVGEDTVLLCDRCGYRANRQVARLRKPAPEPEEPRPVGLIATPGTDTIEALSALLDVPAARTAKAVFRVAEVGEGERFVIAVLRGDTDLNETKLANAVGARSLRPATPEEIRAAGIEPGYGSPVGVRDALVVVDDVVPDSPNLVAGANEAGFHLLNVNHGRDYTADVVADMAAAGSGDACPGCGEPMRAERGVEVGNIFKLGARYGEALGAGFLDRDGKRKPVVMGSYGIGVGRLLACVAEEHRDGEGLVWPVSVAPYHVHLVAPETLDEQAARLCAELEAAGVEVLYDDRAESIGVKLKDADLIGVPVRLVLTSRSLRAGGVELKPRREPEGRIVPPEAVVSVVREVLTELEREVNAP